MKVAILGLGSIGMRHARNYKSLGADVIGFDPTEARRDAFNGEIGGRVFSTEDDILSDNPDLVAITSPNSFHLSQANLALASGCKSLFIEKPIGTDLDEAERFADRVRSIGAYVHVGSNWKFHPAFETMKDWLVQGRLGRVTGAQVIAGQWLPDWHPWEDFRQMYAARKNLGGGAIFDTHELDYMSWLIGPVETFVGLKQHSGSLPIETEDVAGCVMRFKNGALGVLLTDYIQRSGRRRYHVSGDKGTMEWDLATHTLTFQGPKGEPTEAFDVNAGDLNNMYVKQSKRILEDIVSGTRPVTGIDDVLEVLRLQTFWHLGGIHHLESQTTPTMS